MGFIRWTAALMLSVCGLHAVAETGDMIDFSNQLLTYAGYHSGNVIEGRSVDDPKQPCRLIIASVSLDQRLKIGEIFLQTNSSNTIKISTAESPDAVTSTNPSPDRFAGRVQADVPYSLPIAWNSGQTMTLNYTILAQRDVFGGLVYLKVKKTAPWWAVGESSTTIACAFPIEK